VKMPKPKVVQNCSKLNDINHVIFDMDGLLLATEELYTLAANKVAERFAKTTPKVVTWELKVRQMGLQKKDLAKIMVDQLNLTCSPDQYLEETYKYHLELFGNAKLLHGVDRLIRHLHDSNVPIAVATSSSKRIF